MTACVDFEAKKDKLQASRLDHALKTGQFPDGSLIEDSEEAFEMLKQAA